MAEVNQVHAAGVHDRHRWTSEQYNITICILLAMATTLANVAPPQSKQLGDCSFTCSRGVLTILTSSLLAQLATASVPPSSVCAHGPPYPKCTSTYPRQSDFSVAVVRGSPSMRRKCSTLETAYFGHVHGCSYRRHPHTYHDALVHATNLQEITMIRMECNNERLIADMQNCVPQIVVNCYRSIPSYNNRCCSGKNNSIVASRTCQ